MENFWVILICTHFFNDNMKNLEKKKTKFKKKQRINKNSNYKNFSKTSHKDNDIGKPNQQETQSQHMFG